MKSGCRMGVDSTRTHVRVVDRSGEWNDDDCGGTTAGRRNTGDAGPMEPMATTCWHRRRDSPWFPLPPPKPEQPTRSPRPPPPRHRPTGDQAAELERLEADICALAGQLAASTRDWLGMIAEFNRRKGWAQWGIKSCAHWLAWACSVAPGAAREYVRVASALEDLPLLDEAFGLGSLSYSKVRPSPGWRTGSTKQHLARAGAGAHRRPTGAAGPGLPQGGRLRARPATPARGEVVLRRRRNAGAHGAAARRPGRHRRRRTRTGAAPGDWPEARPSESDGRPWNRRADALVAVAQDALAAGPGRQLRRRPAPAGPARGRTPYSGEGGTDRSARRVPDRKWPRRRHIDCGADRLRRSTGGADGLRHPRASSYDWAGRPERSRRRSGAHCGFRDGGCSFPGCHRRTHLEAHHVVHWLRGGSTDLDNLVLLCRRHHMSIHEEGFSVQPGDSRQPGAGYSPGGTSSDPTVADCA